MPVGKRGITAILLLSAVVTAARAQTTGTITTRPNCVPPNGSPVGLNYIQGPDPILLQNGDVAVMVNAGKCCTGFWEGVFSLIYPGAGRVATPRFSGIWASDNFDTELRNEDEVGFPSAIFYGGKWRIAYTATFRCCTYNRDRVGRLDLNNLTYRALTSQVTNQWIKPVDPDCRTLGSCAPKKGSGVLGTFALHPNGDLYVYHPDRTSTCPSQWLRHKINPDMSLASLSGNGCITLNGVTSTPTWVSDIARGADGKLYMLTNPEGFEYIEEWSSTGDAATIGLTWNRTGRQWQRPPHPNAAGGWIYGVWDAGFLKDPNRQIVEPKVVVSQISEGRTWEEIKDVTLGRWYLHYWADAGAPLPPTFGGAASSCDFGGRHDSADCSSITGWAWDPMFPSDSISVDIFDGTTLIGTAPADLLRSGLPGDAYHAFSWPVPASLKNNQAHSIYVRYSGTEKNLPATPRSITCAPSTTYMLTVGKTGSGMVTSSPAGINCGADCTETYNSGTVVNLTPTPTSGWTFANWSGDADCADGSVTMNGTRNCTANFNAIAYALTVTKPGNGTGTVTSSPAGINCGADCTETYNSGAIVSLAAAPGSGSTFAGWGGDSDCTDGTVTMNASRTCTATFNAVTLTNLAAGKLTFQSSNYNGLTAHGPQVAVDGNTDGNYFSGTVTHTGLDSQAWWQVDLGSVSSIDHIKVWNRSDCCPERLSNFYILVSNTLFTSTDLTTTLNQPGVSNYYVGSPAGRPLLIAAGGTGRYVRIQLAGSNYLSIAEVEVFGQPGTPPPDTVWVEDNTPSGAVTVGDNGDGWNWINSSVFPGPYSGALAHQSNIYSGMHQHYFYGAPQTLTINPGDVLFAYVYLDASNPPSQVMLQWHDGWWEHRAYWGANQIGFGSDGTTSRRYMGTLPPAGRWVRLEVAASTVALESRTVHGMAFTLFGGRATWDRAGKSPQP